MAGSRSRWFSKTETRDDALEAIRDASGGFFVLAGIQAALGVIVLKQYSMLFDVAVLVGAAFLRWFNSRAAVVVLLLLPVSERR